MRCTFPASPRSRAWLAACLLPALGRGMHGGSQLTKPNVWSPSHWFTAGHTAPPCPAAKRAGAGEDRPELVETCCTILS